MGRAILAAGICFSLLGIFLAIPFWLAVFPLRGQLRTLSGLPCMLLPISPLLHTVVSVAGLWFSLLGIFLAIPFWLGAFLWRSQLLTLLGLPCMLLHVFPLLTLRVSLCLGILPFKNDASWSEPLSSS